MRLKDLATSVSDTFHLSREHVDIKGGFNVRFDKGTPDEWKQFVASIRANGIIKSILGFKDASDKFIVTDGHRRLAGLDEALTLIEAEITALASPRSAEAKALKEEIACISIIPCESEPKGTTETDRLYSQGIGNTGKPFNLLENALLYERLMRDCNQSDSEIRRRTGITRTAFDNCMILIGAPELHEFIRKGEVTPSLALEVCRKVKGAAERVAIIKQGIQNAKAAGKTHATAKHLNSDVREQVAPSKKQTTSSNGSNGSRSSSGEARSSTRSIESILTSRTSKLLSSVFEPKWGIDGTITLAMNRENSTWFYSLDAERGPSKKLEILTIPWTYGIFNGSPKVVPDAETRGFDDKDEALHQAWRAIRHWLTEDAKPTKGSTLPAIAAIDSLIAKLNGHGGESQGTSNSSSNATRSPQSGAVGNGSRDSSLAPPAPTEEENRLSADLGEEIPADSDAALDGLLRVLGDVEGIGGVKKGNERFLTLKFIEEFFDGKHTHNQLKAFVLYGSTETRDIKVSRR